MVVPRGCPYSEALDLRCRGVVRRTVNAQGLTTGICGAKVSNEETDESIVNTYRQERENNEPCLYIYFFQILFFNYINWDVKYLLSCCYDNESLYSIIQ